MDKLVVLGTFEDQGLLIAFVSYDVFDLVARSGLVRPTTVEELTVRRFR